MAREEAAESRMKPPTVNLQLRVQPWMVAEIDKTRLQANLSCAIRLFVLDQVRNGTNGSTRQDAASI